MGEFELHEPKFGLALQLQTEQSRFHHWSIHVCLKEDAN